MKIYLAGTSLIREREEFLFQANRLFSFYHHKEDGMAHNDFKIRIKPNENIHGNMDGRSFSKSIIVKKTKK